MPIPLPYTVISGTHAIPRSMGFWSVLWEICGSTLIINWSKRKRTMDTRSVEPDGCITDDDVDDDLIYVDAESESDGDLGSDDLDGEAGTKSMHAGTPTTLLVDSDGYAADDDVGDDLNYEDDSGSDSNSESDGDSGSDDSDGEANTKSDAPKPPAGAGTPTTVDGTPLNRISRLFPAWKQHRSQRVLLHTLVQCLTVLHGQTTAGSKGQPGEYDWGMSPVVGSGSTQQTRNTTEAVPPRRAPGHAQHDDAEPSATGTDEEPGPGSTTKRKRGAGADFPPSKQRRL
ncbi:hypothetical protein PHLGIDRAFT_121499 [Phlebiopsis gigantea 11061_1 CR5-6]|uniref:Uncharacterized protein n=1 Tax=Phlebiopsis gigantea (strain 11061_1 CR5-6) TaxID=745531 RepID=A0A0C3PDU4_PHLG1|nr:hypothetical protein PHLGIDRAFT_121499 [Phlebiopsis gigantea 11061_1 CR5-6]